MFYPEYSYVGALQLFRPRGSKNSDISRLQKIPTPFFTRLQLFRQLKIIGFFLAKNDLFGALSYLKKNILLYDQMFWFQA